MQEILTISGSGEDNSFVYIQVITKNEIHFAHIRVFEKGILYSGSYKAVFSDNRTISCGPLLIELRNPFRKWRINFRGYLNDAKGNSHFVILSGWWKCVSNARFFYSNALLKSFNEIYNDKPTALIENLKTIEK